jgi:hypothetical protein
MAKKAKQAVAVEEPQVLELDKKLVIDGRSYNVNAVNADTAGQASNAETANTANKVVNELNIIDAQGKKTSFNGSETSDITVMTPEGGSFSGPITVENHATQLNPKDVLNYSEITDTVLAKIINNSILYTWSDDKLNPALDQSQLNSISIVQGNNNVSAFAEANYNNKKLSAYIFLNTVGDETQIYFGTANSSDPIQLTTAGSAYAASAGHAVSADYATQAGKAGQLSIAQDILVNLGSNKAASFDGTEKASPGITGVLPQTAGGTGVTSLSSVAVGYARVLQDQNDGRKMVTAQEALDVISKANSTATTVANILDTSKTIVVNRASNDSAGTPIRTNYYRSASNTTDANTITISASAPSGGNNGDIWIKY